MKGIAEKWKETKDIFFESGMKMEMIIFFQFDAIL